MFDIGFLLFGVKFDGKKAAIRFAENRMAGVLGRDYSDGKGEWLNIGAAGSEDGLRHTERKKRFAIRPLYKPDG